MVGFIKLFRASIAFHIIAVKLYKVIISVGALIRGTADIYFIVVGKHSVELAGTFRRRKDIRLLRAARAVHSVIYLVPPAVFEIYIGAACLGLLRGQGMADRNAHTSGLAPVHCHVQFLHAPGFLYGLAFHREFHIRL